MKIRMGKLIKIDNKETFRVTGLVKDPPGNTRFQFEYLLPWSYLHHIMEMMIRTGEIIQPVLMYY